MALYLSGNDFGLFRSPDLKSWTQTCTVTLTDCIECPDLFPLPVESDPTDVHWVFWGGNGTYLVGDFDGECFTPHGPTRRHDWGGDSYAAQTWSNAPIHDGRRFQIAWLRVTLPEMPFNQCMTFPCELTLRRISQGHPSGVRLFSEPIRAIERLHRRSARWLRNRVRPGRKPLDAIKGECWHIRGIFRPGGATRFALEVRGVPITYEVAAERLHCQGRSMPLPLQDGLIDLEILVDRVSIEIFGNSGQVALPVGVLLSKEPETLALEVEGGTLMMELLEAFTLRSIWR
jgi:sucrose-6-phosphate hydrolase SacC (GH32 family)